LLAHLNFEMHKQKIRASQILLARIRKYHLSDENSSFMVMNVVSI
jgi:hypothetical protein